MNKLDEKGVGDSSKYKEDLLGFIKNKYFIEIFILIILLIYLIFIGLNYFRQHRYGFEVNKHFYTINQINNLISLPKKFDQKTDLKKEAYLYYRTIAAADNIHLYYSPSDYSSVLSSELRKYKLPVDSKNEWVTLESKYVVIMNYINTNTFIPTQKQGFFCEFYFVNNGLKVGNSQSMQNSVGEFKNYVKFDNTNMYSMDDFYSKHPNDQKYLKFGTCRNFGFYNNWKQDVQIPDVVNKIYDTNKVGLSPTYVGNNEGKPSYNYFFNLSSSKDYPAFTEKDFRNAYNKVSHTYYEK